jgi:hypothetical protein
MNHRTTRTLAITVAAAMLGSGCIGAVTPPPTRGYGPPYAGAGAPIYVKDSRGDWDITEGKKKITSEQALEATGDTEYETRRQIAKEHNEVLHREGKAHRKRGNRMMIVGLVATVGGLILAGIVSQRLRTDTTSAAGLMPEMITHDAGGAAVGTNFAGWTLMLGGTASVLYGYAGGKRPPPYFPWRTPRALDRPAYVRQQTEPYNEKLGASSMPEDVAPALGAGKRPATTSRKLPPMRGGR